MRVSGIIARLLAVIALLAATGASWAQLADVQIRNVYRADQAIHIENGFVQSSPAQPNWQSALWKVEIVAAPYTVRLKNAWKGTYLNVETGPVAATAAPPGWLSAQWVLEPVAGMQNTFRIKNAWKGTYLHTETGMLAIGAIQPGWTSAMWLMGTAQAAANVAAARGFNFVDEETQPGGPLSTDAAPKPWLTAAAADWMAKLPDTKLLREISIPGTHDTGARYGGVGCETQVWSIAQQLEAGIRYLDIRNRRTGNTFSIHHGPCYQQIGFSEVMNQVRAFLTAHPGETLLMRVKEEHTAADGSDSFATIWANYMKEYGSLFVQDHNASIKSTLGSLRGKVVVLRNADFSGYGMEMFGNATIDIFDQYKVYFLAHDNPLDGISYGQKQRMVAEYIAKAGSSQQMVVNHLSGAMGMTPRHLAGFVNESAYNSIGLYTGARTLGVLVMDFPGDRLIYRIIKSNFVSGTATSCAGTEYRTDSAASFAIFKLPASPVGHKVEFKGGAYNHYVFPRGCNRVTWTDLKFACGPNGQWSRTGSWDSDALCTNSNTSQTGLVVGDK